MRLVICVLGDNFSSKWVQSLIKTLSWCSQNSVEVRFNNTISSNVYIGRDAVLGGQQMLDENQRILGFDYDYLLWIDSDQVWEPQDLEKLIEADKDIISGAIKMASGVYAQCWKETHENILKGIDNRVKEEDLKSHIPFEIDFCGFGFVLIKKGVYESIKYPWHKPIPYSEYGDYINAAGYMGEDTGWCIRVKEQGFKIWLHPKVRIGHEKKLIV